LSNKDLTSFNHQRSIFIQFPMWKPGLSAGASVDEDPDGMWMVVGFGGCGGL
jgi:hypothetical protein